MELFHNLEQFGVRFCLALQIMRGQIGDEEKESPHHPCITNIFCLFQYVNKVTKGSVE